ncbi:SDR family oxidoreductase [Nocardia amamiensis]|uniref:SDR family oxidoreductase n=1 Tax=Nocardia amamiensis TaxID=404578 RepID=A0ABS0CNJ6_9NOCA|nr:SDR family oxidoreductase [Nocardia amamiensis]MBF6298125.1 SDR family oxidoreductase [Nocardia amamiensis]
MSEPVDSAPADKPLAGKTALVTEAHTGIGKKIAKTLAAQGAQVVVHNPHIPEWAADVVKEITSAGGAALALAADVADRAEYQELVEVVLEDCGRWDLLVHTAAVPEAVPFTQVSADAFDTGFAATVRGVFHGMQLAAQHLAEGGRIVTVCDSPNPGGAVYDATRGAVEQLGQAVAPDFVPRRITVNTISHGVGTTDNAELETAIAAMNPAEPAAVVAYLAGEAASTVTAQAIRLGGAAQAPR